MQGKSADRGRGGIMSKGTGKSKKAGKVWLVIIVVLMLAGVIGNVLDENPEFMGGNVSGSRLAVLNTDSERLSDLDGIEAQEGYHYYKITIEYYNSGAQAASHYQLMGYFSGKGYDDIYESDRYDSGNPFEEAALEILPAGKSGSIERYIQVKDGVSSIKFEYFDSSSSGRKKTTINL